MASTMLTSSFLGKQLLATPVARRSVAPQAARQVVAIFKTDVSKKTTSSKNGKAPVLVAGKDIPAQQFKIAGKTVTLGFTKSNELFVGRLAMLGFAAQLIGEILTGKGAIAQLGFETGLPIQDVDGLILFLIGFNLIAAFLPAKGKFVPDEEELEERPAGALQNPNVSILNPKEFFGVTGFGFTKSNELFVGRMAQLGFAASLIGEALTGKGPLAQVGLETGIPLNEAEPLLLFFIIFTLFAAVNEGSGKFVEEK